MQIQDDRTTAQKESHPMLIIGTDRAMSGWGKAAGGQSYAAWACPISNERKVRAWVEGRNDMQRVRSVYGAYKPNGTGHVHIYVVDTKHAALA